MDYRRRQELTWISLLSVSQEPDEGPSRVHSDALSANIHIVLSYMVRDVNVFCEQRLAA